MEQFFNFAKGPLFKFCFAVMVFGLLRSLVITLFGIGKSLKNANDKKVPYLLLLKETVYWLFPLKYTFSSRAFFSAISFLFHLGIVIVPIFLLDHILLWRSGIGFSWPHINKVIADILTLVSIGTGFILLLNRLFHSTTRYLSSFMDYILLLFLEIILITGYIASRPYNPIPYTFTMLIHVLGGNGILLLLPFTKLAHCVLYPFLRIASNIAWRFPPKAGEKINKALYGEEIRKI